MKPAALLAIATLLSTATGPLPKEENALTVALCDGGTLSIPIGDDDGAPSPCHAKGCHAGNCRKQFDAAQRRQR